MDHTDLKVLLEQEYHLYNQESFIKDDPISVPHRFSKQQDIEIAGFFASIFAWGQRKTIINKANLLMDLMDEAPHDFILNHADQDLARFKDFKHRTFNAEDTWYFIEFLKHHYSSHDTLEEAFTRNLSPNDETIENALKGFRPYFFSLEGAPKRTQKHIASPMTKSTCKRLCM